MLYFAVCIGIIAIDMLTKLLAIKNLAPISTFPLWDGVFHLTYVENRGAAFGIFQNSRIFLILVTVLILTVLILTAKKYKGRSKTLNTAIALISAGAVGNLIDRIFRGFVVDFFDFRLINFPVFNVADIFVCVGVMLIVVFILFFEESKKDCEDDEI